MSKIVRKPRPQINYDEQQVLQKFVDPDIQGYDPAGDEDAKTQRKQRLQGDVQEDELNQNIESELYEFGHEGGYASAPNIARRGGYTSAPSGGFAFAPFLPLLAPLVVEGVKGLIGLFRKKPAGTGESLEKLVWNDPDIQALAAQHNMHSGSGFFGDLWVKVKEGIKNIAGKLLTEVAPNVLSKAAERFANAKLGNGLFGNKRNYMAHVKSGSGLAHIDGLKMGHLLNPVMRAKFSKVLGDDKADKIIAAIQEHPENKGIFEQKVEDVLQSKHGGTFMDDMQHRLMLAIHNAKTPEQMEDYVKLHKAISKKQANKFIKGSRKMMDGAPNPPIPIGEGKKKKGGWVVKVERQ
jgi:hypothetical protein